MDIKNLARNVLNDESKGKVTYYFTGKNYPFIQLNATGIINDNEDVNIKLSGDEYHPIRELVGLFGSQHSWYSAAAAESILLRDFSFNTRKTIAPMMIDGKKIETFLPSKEEYKANPVVARKVYDACGGSVWSRLRSDVDSAWSVFNSDGDLYINDISYSYHYAPAFNLDLSKILMVRDAVSGRAIMDYSDSFKPYKSIKEFENNEIKFLAQIDDTVVHVEKKDDGTLICRTKVDHYHSYLSTVIVDKDDNILYYNLLSGFNRFNDDDSKKYDESIQRIKLPEGLPEGCRIGLFTETRNAEYYMDTCGEITWLSIKDGQIGDAIESDNSDLNKSIATNKKIVELPYEIGDTIYIVESSDNHYSVIRAKVDSYVIGKNAKIVLHVYDDCGDFNPKELLLDRITESIFANKEDALKKLTEKVLQS